MIFNFQLVTLAVFTALSVTSYADSALSGDSPPDTLRIKQRERVEKKEWKQKTADNQTNKTSSLEITRMIRKELTSDDSLSTNAKNVKIITDSKSVMLRGPVPTVEEKLKIEAVAQKVATNHVIQNELEVKQ